MKTNARTLWWGGTLSILPILFVLATGCGPSRKQYAINEALLVDQTRVLENEVYRTRYQLQQCLAENDRLRKELGDDTDTSGESPATTSSSSTRTNHSRSASGVTVPAPQTVPTPIRSATPRPSSLAPMAPARTSPLVPQPASRSGASPSSVPSPRAIFPKQSATGNGTTGESVAKNVESLPSTIIVPAARTRTGAPPLAGTPGETRYGAGSAPVRRNESEGAAPTTNSNRKPATNTVPPEGLPILQMEPDSSLQSMPVSSSESAGNALLGERRVITNTSAPTQSTSWIWSTESDQQR